ncbi:sugar ABC transporter substrate-binding protein [Loktanella sp. IMCC34160]|uniref:ABC transporter substrate-binding protein n=1 Tax=Loktanella sp. IMCC34160 TaxID=2510646 RepID=UPI00101B783A|nr:sugar ABC transporter substrate-binding protein [Loktanella sp. IMCC34160]RYG89154.1 sugar ABC transporter substrate-binding protein [Loktanella sp. IMCC34160]
MKYRTKLTVSALAFAAATAAQAETTLNILMTEGLDKAAMEAVAAEYMATNPDVTIEIQALPWSQFFQVSDLRLRSGDEEVDLIYTDAPVVANYAANGYIVPFEGEIADEAKSTLVDAAIKAGTFEGRLFALPMNSSAQVLYYNADLLEGAGVTPPVGLAPGSTASAEDIAAMATDGRWTWEQLRDAAKAVTVSEGGRTETWGFAFEQFGELYQLQPLGASLGGTLISDDAMSAADHLDGAAWREAAGWWSALFNTDEVSPRALGFGEATQMFLNGQLAMFVGGTWNVPAVADSDINFGIAAHPRFADGTAASPTGSWFLGVHAASPDIEAARDFAAYATLSPEGTETWFANLNQLPTTLELLARIDTDAAYDGFPGNVMRLSAWESRNTAVPRPVTVAYSQLQDAFRTAFVDIANGVDIDEALVTAVDAYDEAARRLNRQ